MMYLKLIKDTDDQYEYGNFWRNKTRSTDEMHILETFLLCDVRHHYKIYLDLVYNAESYGGIANITCIEKEDGYIYLSDSIFLPEEGQEPLRFKMSIKEFEKLMIVWETKILTPDPKKRPSEVIIWYDNDHFFLDIKQ